MNDENLKPGAHQLTVEEQSRGGRASGAVRGFKAAMKKRIKDNPSLTDELISTLWELALNEHNLKAIEMILRMNDEDLSDLDKKLKRAQLAKIKAETEEIRRRSDDGDGFSEEERRSLADALTAAETVWRDGDDETSTNGV